MIKLLKKMMMWMALAVLVSATPVYAGNSVDLRDGREVVMSVGYDPMDSAGIPYTEDIASGNFVAGKVIMPTSAQALAEFDALAVIMPALAVGADGREYRAYVIAAGYDCAMRRQGIFVIPDLTDPAADVHLILLSRRVEMAWTPNGGDTQGFDSRRFRRDATFRREFVRSQGMPISFALPATAMMRELFPRWDRYARQGRGEFITPFTSEQVEYLSGMNPGYRFGERFVRTANVSLSPDLIGTAIGAVFDVGGALFGRSVGFDRRSNIGREQYGNNLLFQDAQMRAAVTYCSRAPQTAGR